ncbi:MAG: SatD family protein [Saccharofermentanales bacterium]
MEVINKINKKYKNSISSHFTINSCDSFQGLLHNGNQRMEILIVLELELHPLKIRIGMGIGSIYTAIYKENSNLIDGEGIS